jgi:hypothetical protein
MKRRVALAAARAVLPAVRRRFLALPAALR